MSRKSLAVTFFFPERVEKYATGSTWTQNTEVFSCPRSLMLSLSLGLYGLGTGWQTSHRVSGNSSINTCFL